MSGLPHPFEDRTTATEPATEHIRNARQILSGWRARYTDEMDPGQAIVPMDLDILDRRLVKALAAIAAGRAQ